MLTSGGEYGTTYKEKTEDAVADYYHECKQPNSSYKAGETASLSMRLYTKNSGVIHHNGKCWAYLDKHYDGYNGTGTPAYSYFTSPNSKDKYVLEADNGKTFAEGMIHSLIHSLQRCRTMQRMVISWIVYAASCQENVN